MPRLIIGRCSMASEAAFCVIMHVAGLAAMAFLLRGGILTEPSVRVRMRYIADHSLGWTIGWIIWMLAGLSIVAFYAWWARQLAHSNARILPLPLGEGRGEGRGASRWQLSAAGVLLAAIGMICDWTGESISAFALVESAVSPNAGFESFLKEERSAMLLTAGAANFFYSLGGLLLMLATPDLPRWVRGTMWATWAAGLVMALSAVAGVISGIVVTTVLLFPLLIVWVGWMGLRWRMA
jgi:hypothetical protein